jgi:hypothetical protein
MEYSSNSNVTMVPRGGAAQQSACERFGTRVQLGNYIADIVADNQKNPSVHHCIVQRVGSPNVLYLGQESTFAAALESAYRRLEELVGPRPKKKTAAIYEFKAPTCK